MHMCREMTGQEAGQRGDQQIFAANMILLRHDGLLRGKVLHHSPCKRNDSLVRRNKAERSRRPREADFEDRRRWRMSTGRLGTQLSISSRTEKVQVRDIGMTRSEVGR